MRQTYKEYNLVIFYIIVFIQIGFAQSSLSTSGVLATAKNQISIALKDRKIEAMNAMTTKLPFIESVDFQTGTDFMLKKQQLRAKASFNGPQEIKSIKQQKEADRAFERTDRNSLFHNVLLDRYNLLVEYQFAQKNLIKYYQLHKLFTEKLDVLQKLAKLSGSFNIEDLIKAEDASFDYQQKILESEGTIRHTHQFLALTMNSTDTIRIDTSNWIPFSMLRSLIAELPSTIDKNPVLAQQDAAITVVQSAYNLEKAQLKKLIDNVQIQNSVLSNEFVATNWGMSVGILIPYKGSSKIQLNDILLKRLDEENKLKGLQNSLALQVFDIRQDLDLILKEYDFVQKQVIESQTLYSRDQYAKIQGSSPVVLLRMQELVLGREVSLLNLEHIAYQKYIKLLDLTGKLSEMPLKNYLSSELVTF